MIENKITGNTTAFLGFKSMWQGVGYVFPAAAAILAAIYYLKLIFK